MMTFLIMHRGTDVARERLMETFWSDVEPERARDNVKTSLAFIRRCLKATGLEPDAFVQATRSTVRWISPTDVDAERFARLASEGAGETLRGALQIYRGDFLEGDYDNWAVSERARLSGLYEGALARAVLDSQDVEAAQRLISLNPYNEEAYAALVEADLSAGRRSSAVAWIERCRTAFLELGEKPSVAFESRFQDVARRRALDASPNNLPRQPTSLIGRDREIAEVIGLLAKSHSVTIIGSGGVGKTRLAIAVAAIALEGSDDGVWFVDFARIPTTEYVLSEIATVLGLQAQGERPLLGQLVAHLKSKRMLVVFDNCEHVVSEIAQVVAAILRSCPRVRLLATSREDLHVFGEQIYSLGPLLVPTAQHGRTADEALEFPAVELFVSRATAADSHFRLDDRNSPAVSAICASVDGIPLAIELAAARVTSYSLTSLLDRLSEHLKILTRGDRSAHPRQQTMRGSIDWSFNLLEEAERAVLRRAAAFQGGWTLEAARAVCSGAPIDESAVMDLLSSLVSRSLVSVEFRDDSQRFRLLESVRQFGMERLNVSGELADVARRHAVFFATFARRMNQTWKSMSELAWKMRLEDDVANIRGALDWCLSRGNDVVLGAGLTKDLWYFWHSLHYLEGRRWLEAARAEGPQLDDRLKIELDLAVTRLLILGAKQEVLDASDRALRGARALGDKRLLRRATYYYGEVRVYHNLLEEAEPVLREAVDLAREAGDESNLGTRLFALCTLHRKRGELDEARRLLSQAKDLYRDPLMQMIGVMALEEAILEHRTGNVTRSIEVLTQFADLSTADLPFNRPGYTIVRIALAYYMYLAGHYDDALANVRTAIHIGREEGFSAAVSLSIKALVPIAIQRRKFEYAAMLFGYCVADLDREGSSFENWVEIDAQAIDSALREHFDDDRLLCLRREGATWTEDHAIETALMV